MLNKTFMLVITFCGLVVTTADSEKETVERKCNRGCPFNYELICASNGKSYDNICLMELASCELGEKLHIIKHGRCDDESLQEEI